VHIFNFAELNC